MPTETREVYESAEVVAAREAAMLAIYKRQCISEGYRVPMDFPSEHDRSLILRALKAAEPRLVWTCNEDGSPKVVINGRNTPYVMITIHAFGDDFAHKVLMSHPKYSVEAVARFVTEALIAHYTDILNKVRG